MFLDCTYTLILCAHFCRAGLSVPVKLRTPKKLVYRNKFVQPRRKCDISQEEYKKRKSTFR